MDLFLSQLVWLLLALSLLCWGRKTCTTFVFFNPRLSIWKWPLVTRFYMHNSSFFQHFPLGDCLSDRITRLFHPMHQSPLPQGLSKEAPFCQCGFPAAPWNLYHLHSHSDISRGLPFWYRHPSCSKVEAGLLSCLTALPLLPCGFLLCCAPCVSWLLISLSSAHCSHFCSQSQACCHQLMATRDICFLPLPHIPFQGGLWASVPGKFSLSLEKLNWNAQEFLLTLLQPLDLK